MKRIILGLLFVAFGLQTAHAFEQSIQCDAEPTDMVVEYGTIVSCSVETSGDTDSYRFNGQSGDVLVIQATYDSGTLPCIELIAPDNSRIEACENSFHNRIDTVLDQTGTYSIIVSSWSSTGTGNYTVGLDCVLPVSEESPEVHFGEELTGEISPVGDLDLFHLTSSGNDNVALTVAYVDGTLPCVELVGPDNSRVEACDNAFSNEIDTLLDQVGIYSIIVSSWSSSGTGNYTIGLQCLSGDCINMDDDTDSDDGDDTGTDDGDDSATDDDGDDTATDDDDDTATDDGDDTGTDDGDDTGTDDGDDTGTDDGDDTGTDDGDDTGTDDGDDTGTDDGDDTGTDDGDDTGTDDGDDTTTATFDATGEWTATTSNHWVDQGNSGGCSAGSDETYYMELSQTGNSVVLTGNDRDYQGTVSGSDYTCSASYAEDGGTTTERVTFTLSSDSTGSGKVTWDWADGVFYCSGGFDIQVSRTDSQGDDTTTDSDGNDDGDGGGGGGCFLKSIID